MNSVVNIIKKFLGILIILIGVLFFKSSGSALYHHSDYGLFNFSSLVLKKCMTVFADSARMPGEDYESYLESITRIYPSYCQIVDVAFMLSIFVLSVVIIVGGYKLFRNRKINA